MLLEVIELREKEYEILLEILQLNVELTPQTFSDIMLRKFWFFFQPAIPWQRYLKNASKDYTD